MIDNHATRMVPERSGGDGGNKLVLAQGREIAPHPPFGVLPPQVEEGEVL